MAKADFPPDQQISNYLAANFKRIAVSLMGGKEEEYILRGQHLRMIKLGKVSSVAIADLTLRNSSSGEENTLSALIKYFESELAGRVYYKDFAQSAKDTCELLDGAGGYPRVYLCDKNGGIFMVTEKVGEKTLDEAVRGFGSLEMRTALQTALPYISRFQIEATKKLGESCEQGKMTRSLYASIFGRRPSRERMADYLRAILMKDHEKQVDRTLKRKILESSGPIQTVYMLRKGTFRVTHGDCILKNIAVNDARNPKGFFDAGLTLGDPLLDLGAMLSTPGLNLGPEDWKDLSSIAEIADYREVRECSRINIEKERGIIAPYLNRIGVPFTEREAPGSNLFTTFAAIFYRSARILAKVSDLQRKFPETYEQAVAEDSRLTSTPEEMRRNMALSLDTIVSSPQDFGIGERETIQLSELRNALIQEGIIPSNTRMKRRIAVPA